MVRKRSFPRHREGLTDPPLYSAGLNKLAKTQNEGEDPYGDAVVDKELRLGRPLRFTVGLPPPPGTPSDLLPHSKSCSESGRSVSYVPPSRVIPNSGEISDVLNEMTRDVVIPDEEFRMIDEARQLGWSWTRIVNELQGRTPKQLMKIYSDVDPC